MTKPMLKLVPLEPPNRSIFCKCRARHPTRLPNAAYRSREYLTPTEMDALLEAGPKDAAWASRCRPCSSSRTGNGFRASEVCDLRWDQIDLDQARLHVKRAKRGMPSDAPHTG